MVDSIFTPYNVGSLTLPNRIILSAMSKGLCTRDGTLTENYFEYYRTMSKSGVSLITTGAMIIDSDWPSFLEGQPWITDDSAIPELKKLTDIIHSENIPVIFQLYHPGQVQYQKTKPKTINDLTVEELHEISDKFAAAALRAFKAGADGVDVHMAHTYLLSQFLSPYFNHRTDCYGCDTVEQSLCFGMECIDKIRAVTGPDFILTAKINCSDFVENGMTPKRAAQVAACLEKAGIAMITVSGGGNQTDITGMSADGNRLEGWKLPACRIIKEAVSIPVAGTGSIRHPWYVRRCIEDGDCDLVSMGRTFLAEPKWLEKTKAHREGELRYCISCLHCLNDTVPNIPGCSVNPLCCLEANHPQINKNGNGRTVSIIGAGPAGLECAITLAQREFKVTVFEEEQEIGGMMTLAAVPPGKQKLRWALDFYLLELKRLGVKLCLGHKVLADEIKQNAPAAVIVATGSHAFIPPIPGIDGEQVRSVRDVLRERQIICNRNVVILGGGLTGLECARMMSRQGNCVTVLEMLPEPASPQLELRLARDYARADGVLLLYSSKVKEILPQMVTAIRNDGSTFSVDADLVILSLGVRPQDGLYTELCSTIPNVFKIGDCNEIGKIVNAVFAGSRLGYDFNI